MSFLKKLERLRDCPLALMIVISSVLLVITMSCINIIGQYNILPEYSSPVFAKMTTALLDEWKEYRHTNTLNELSEMVRQNEAGTEVSDEEIQLIMGEVVPELPLAEDTSIEEISVGEQELEEETAFVQDEVIEEMPVFVQDKPIEEMTLCERYEYGGELVKRSDVLTEYVKWNDNPARSSYYENPGIRPLTSYHNFHYEEEPCFGDSIFIGDSRMQGLCNYSGWKDTTFLYRVGLTIYNVTDDYLSVSESGKTTLFDVLSSEKYRNIYIMLGINELGSGTDKSFAERYKEVVDIIRSLQPNSRIVIMGIMYVTTDYSNANNVYNNDNINARNAAIAEFANGMDICYLDMNGCIIDETGGLNPEYTSDGVHLKAQYYDIWAEWMRQHAY